MHPDYATSTIEEPGEWIKTDNPEGPIAGQLMRLEKATAALLSSTDQLEQRVQAALSPESQIPEKATAEGNAVQPLHSPLAMALGTIVNKIERATKHIEDTRTRVEL